MYPIDFIKRKKNDVYWIHIMSFMLEIPDVCKKTERSDTITLGILDTLVHFRHSAHRPFQACLALDNTLKLI
jgi:hypothetical protein